jgi:DNA-directed RNA polymerase specialized sigma subunit
VNNNMLSINRIKYLRDELEAGQISMTELREIQEAFAEIPEEQLREPTDNALAGDMLDELEERVSPLEMSIYDYVLEEFGEEEAKDPKWDIGSLAKHIEDNFIVEEK